MPPHSIFKKSTDNRGSVKEIELGRPWDSIGAAIAPCLLPGRYYRNGSRRCSGFHSAAP